MTNILITGVGGPTPRSFVRAIKLNEEAHDQYRFIGVDCNPLAYGLYDRDLFEKGYVVPRADDPDYWDAINEIVEKESIDAAVVLPEVEVLEWAKNHRSRLNRDIKVHLPDYELANTLVNKHRLHDLL
jgi:carbamoyl-phosphate synthase large subunit